MLALGTLRRVPLGYWRWDHVIRLLVASGLTEPFTALRTLLEQGLLFLRHVDASREVTRFDNPLVTATEATGFVSVARPAWTAIGEHLPQQPSIPGKRGSNWQAADGWELPLRLAVLWRMAARLPVRRTQANLLFKRDRERICADSLLAAPMLGAKAAIAEPGQLVFALAAANGWVAFEDEAPARSLLELWPDNLTTLLHDCARGIIAVDVWNELGESSPLRTHGSEMASARLLVLSWLTALPGEAGASIGQLAERIARVHPPWFAGPPVLKRVRLTGPTDPMARDWVRAFLLGPMFQCGMIEVDETTDRDCLVRLSRNGRKLMDGPSPEAPSPPLQSTLLAQPNHEVIVYRQGLTIGLLARLMLFAEPMSLGAALTFEINADSIYHGLEAGLDADQILRILEVHGGRAAPPTMAASIRTWSEKRDRIRVFSNATLIEFSNETDLQAALARGLAGEQVSERLVLIAPDQSIDLRPFRITASRDYRLPVAACVKIQPDGVTLAVDQVGSDLMLDAELRRFCEPLSSSDAVGCRQYRVTTQSLVRALERGLGMDALHGWFVARTGGPPPAAVVLMARGIAGIEVQSRAIVVVQVADPLDADGLAQHPDTAPLLVERLGPCALAVLPENVARLSEALGRLGIALKPIV